MPKTLVMLRRWLRDLWGRRTEKKALNPEMRSMLVNLDGVYAQESSTDPRESADPEQRSAKTRRH